MSTVNQSNVLHAITANVIEGAAKTADFTGLQVAPGIAQQSLTANWPVIRLADGEMLRDNLERREPGATFKQVEATIGLDTSTVEGDGCEIPIDRSIAEDAENSGLELLSVYGLELLKNALRMHESRTAAIAQGADFDSVNSTTAYTTANIATIDVPQDLQDAIERVAGRGENPNTITIPVEVWNRIRFSDRLRAFIAGSVNPGALVTAGNLALAFADEGIERVIIGRARVNTGAKKKVDISTIWNSSHIWVGAALGATADTGSANSLGSAISTFYSGQQVAPFQIEQYYSDERRSHILRVYGETNVKVLNARAGTRIATQYA